MVGDMAITVHAYLVLLKVVVFSRMCNYMQIVGLPAHILLMTIF